MSAEEVLKANEREALKNNQFVSHVTGKVSQKSSKKKSFGAAFFVTAILAVFLVFFNSGNLVPSVISDRLIEATDVQYADAIESKILVFQQALASGDVPENTAARLKDNNVLVGYMLDGEFVEGNQHNQSLVIKNNGKIITASEFAEAVKSDVQLYDAFNKATYSRAAYYYDESANQVFKKIGTNRNNYTKDADFDEVMSKIVGEGSDIDVNSVALMEKTIEENGETKTITYYGTTGVAVDSSSASAAGFVEAVSNKNTAESSNKATMNAANALNVADTVSKEQKSSLLFLAFMENISKMKAGDGNESKINDAMNYLYRSEETEVVDVETGEVIKVSGSMVESPSMYAILSGERIEAEKVKNYASDRILKTVENRTGVMADGDTLNGTVTSAASRVRGSIGRYINNGSAGASSEALSAVIPTVSSSLIDNSFSDIKGISGGEMLVEGAVNVGKELAKASGATAGDAEAVKSYARLNSTILAMDAATDRLNRSPFDVTSKNTFLGSIMYKLAISLSKSGTLLSQMAIMPKMVTSAIGALLPATYADDEADQYLSNFGDCETMQRISAVGSATCSMIATFDTSTLNDTFNDAGFVAFVEANTILENGVRTIKQNSVLADFIKYNDERQTPIGVTDGGILDSINSGSTKISFLSDILTMIKTFLGSSESSKRIASGAAFVNSSNNGDWQTYKYAQRYVSLARATAALRQYDGDETAYSSMRFFEGAENPVVAFLNNYYDIASR